MWKFTSGLGFGAYIYMTLKKRDMLAVVAVVVKKHMTR